MKQIMCSIIATIFAAYSFAQELKPAPLLNYNEYAKKHRNQKTAAWLLLGVGTAGLIGTGISDAIHTLGTTVIPVLTLGTVEPEPTPSYIIPYTLSALCLASSIPLFISAVKNKKKANLSVSYFKMEKIRALRSSGFVSQSYPCIVVKIRI